MLIHLPILLSRSLPCHSGADSVVGITVGSRCQIMPGARRGTVAFVGEIEQLKAGDLPVTLYIAYPHHYKTLIHKLTSN